MNLYDILQSRNLRFRQHLPEEGWTKRALTVVDLSEAQQQALDQEEIPGLTRALAKSGQWSFPATDIASGQAPRSTLDLATAKVVASPDLLPFAKQFGQDLETSCSITLPLLSGQEAGVDLLESSDVIVFGAAHQSRFALDFSLRYHSGFLDAAVPGRGGWAVTTHCGLNAAGRVLVQVAADHDTASQAVKALFEQVTRTGDDWEVPAFHRLEPGRELREGLPSWEKLLSDFVARYGARDIVLGNPPESSDEIPAWAAFLAQGLQSGGPEVNFYNQLPLAQACECVRYYQVSADRRALALFRALLLEVAEYYLGDHEGASYPSDFDFMLGPLVLCFSRYEHDPVFSDEDRLLLRNLLLAGARSVHEYAVKFWPPRKKEGLTRTRHNHQTFPARSLLYASDYFSRYEIAEAEEFRAYTDQVFAGGLWDRAKQFENAAAYEVLVYLHGAAYSSFTGQRLDLFQESALRGAANRIMICTDNFFRTVDCGDSSLSLDRGKLEGLPALVSSCYPDPHLEWYGRECLRHSRNFAWLHLTPTEGLTGIRAYKAPQPPPTREWEVAPLDPIFAREIDPGFPCALGFDKAAFRSGWDDSSHYLLLEGVGGDSISHSHLDCNAIVRLNHLGRHWLVSNGYGRRIGITNSAESFSTRIRGPEDHNMLVLEGEGEPGRDLPPFAACLHRAASGDLALFTGAAVGWRGLNWFRTVCVVADQCVLVLDRVQVGQTAVRQACIEWQILGECHETTEGFRFQQEGVVMHLASPSGWSSRRFDADRSADWQKVLASGKYPYARFPLTTVRYEVPGLESGQVHTLATLISAQPSSAAPREITRTGDGRMLVRGVAGPDQSLSAGDVHLQLRDGCLEVRHGDLPELPCELREFAAKRWTKEMMSTT